MILKFNDFIETLWSVKVLESNDRVTLEITTSTNSISLPKEDISRRLVGPKVGPLGCFPLDPCHRRQGLVIVGIFTLALDHFKLQ